MEEVALFEKELFSHSLTVNCLTKLYEIKFNRMFDLYVTSLNVLDYCSVLLFAGIKGLLSKSM